MPTHQQLTAFHTVWSRVLATKAVLALAVCGVSAFATGCVEAGETIYGERVEDVPLEVFKATTGIYPDASVLDDPGNPFANSPPLGDLKWDIESRAGNVVAFYSWATVLAYEPTGEAQYYTALNLQQVYQNGQAVQDDLELVREMAIAAYQSVLDNFPDAQSFDATGTFAFDLVTPAYQAILDLDGVVDGDWVLVSTPNGQTRAVQR